MTSVRRITRPVICAAAVTGLAALAAACGTAKPTAATGASASSARPGTTATPAKTATSVPAATGPATPSPSGSHGGGSATGPGAAGSASGCSSRYLRADVGATQGTAGSVYTVLVFTNLNNASCTLYGYPGVSFGAGTPVTQVGLAAAENSGTPRELVTLKPGGVASAQLQIVDAGNFSPSQCHRVTTSWLQVYPPNQTAPLYVHYTSDTCAKRVQILTVGAVRPGSGG
jgi:Protein of unknown function (DUF4232)